MHLALQKFYEFYDYVWVAMSYIGAFYITELWRIVGIQNFNNCSLLLFAYSAGICINLSSSWKFTSACIFGNMVYFFTRLGFHFNEFPVNLITICVICWVFYLVNIIVFEISQKQDKALINKFSALSLSMCRLVDYIPYAVLIENGKEILFFNNKLIELLQLSTEDQGGHDALAKIEKRLKDTKVSCSTENRTSHCLYFVL